MAGESSLTVPQHRSGGFTISFDGNKKIDTKKHLKKLLFLPLDKNTVTQKAAF